MTRRLVADSKVSFQINFSYTGETLSLGVYLLKNPDVTIPYEMEAGAIVATVPDSVQPHPFNEVQVVATEGFPVQRE